MASPALLALLVVACLVAPAAAHYCTVTGSVYCDSCGDGKKGATDGPAKGAQVALTCDVGNGRGPYTQYARTGADGMYTFVRVQTEQNYKNMKYCSLSLVATNDKTCNVPLKAGPLDVRDPVKGVLLQFGATYKLADLSLKKAVKPADCPLCTNGGSMCGDPRLVGGDGVPFWFHGRKDGDFCIVSDHNLHINAHFIGKAVAEGHDLTWVQAIAILFGTNKLYIGTQQQATWDAKADHLLFSLNGEVLLPVSNTADEAVYASDEAKVRVVRSSKPNVARIEIENLLAVNVEARPIGRDQWTEESCFAHLDMALEFSQLSGSAEGVLGQTYQRLWSPPNIKEGLTVASYILGDVPSYTSSSLFAADCPVSIFEATPYDVPQVGAMAHKLAVMDDMEEDEETFGSTLCSNDKVAGGLKCTTR